MIEALHNGASRAVVTAHPDDETLWCAGLLLRYPGDWTIICCSTPRRDPVRAWKFFKACETLGAKGMVMPYTETRNFPLEHLDEVDLENYDLIVTHGKAGEYGHPHHCQIHEFIKKHRDFADVLTFGYGRKKESAPDLEIELTNAEWRVKMDALKCYDHEMNWAGRMRPTWEALIDEYGTKGKFFGFDLKRECYDAL
jgi:LmbE family N-acetylglucosaminyl deacetylase